MDNLTNSILQIDYEIINREGGVGETCEPSRIVKPTLLDRTMTALGEALIRLGSGLKEHSHHHFTAEQDAESNFMIML